MYADLCMYAHVLQSSGAREGAREMMEGLLCSLRCGADMDVHYHPDPHIHFSSIVRRNDYVAAIHPMNGCSVSSSMPL